MSSAIKLDNELNKSGTVELPGEFQDINPHNLYLYVKSYQASIRSNTARAKTRAEVSGGGKKPWSQKGRGGARAGSNRSPVWVGGGKAFGPTKRNYNLKINKKQKKLAFEYSLNQKAAADALFVVDSIKVESGKTKDAKAIFDKLNVRDALFVVDSFDEKTYLAFRNLSNCYLVEPNEVNAYLVSAFRSVVIEEAVINKMLKIEA